MRLIIKSVSTIPIMVPLTFALGTSAAVVKSAPMLLIDLLTSEGIVGRSYLFCYKPSAAKAVAGIVHEAVGLLAGDVVAPVGNAAKLERSYALLGVTGITRMALSAIDVALWDATATSANLPLATMLGGGPGKVRAYNSCGLGLMAAEAVAGEAEKLLAMGFDAIKLRLGYPTLAQDIATTRAVRKRVPADTVVMVDYNQALSEAEAITRGRALQHEGIYWFEEPIRHDDLDGNARVAAALDVPLQLGENLNGVHDLARAATVRASDYLMPDVARVGGVTGWMQAAGIAAAAGIEMSSHLFPEISGPLLRATPSCHWLEYVDWANAFLEQPMAIDAGYAVVSDRPGLGLSWDPARVAKLRMD